MKNSSFEIYCDFDGTVTQKDAVNFILEKLADPQWNNIEAEWIEGKITSSECLSKQLPLVKGGWKAIADVLNSEIKLEPDFKSFSIWCVENDVPLHIVSDGLDKVIDTVLGKENIKVTSIWSNKLKINDKDEISVSFPQQSKYLNCKLGLCKCKVIDKSKPKSIKVLIGDGLSDTCWAKKADLIFAKSKLLEYCKENNLPFVEFKNFTQIATYIQERESKPKKKEAVLLIHGLTGTPTEMRPISKHLQNLGYTVDAPMLAGHGKGHKEILQTTWQDWLDSARSALKKLILEHDDVYIVSLSVGCLIGALLAEENPKVKGLAMLSIAYGTPSPGTPKLKCLLPLVFKFPFLRKKLFWTESPPYGIKNKRLQRNIEKIMKISNNGESTEHGFFRTYVESLYQHKLLEKEVRRKAFNISCPALMIHSLEDTMLSPSNSASIYKDLGSINKKIKYITGCDHVMTVDLKKDEVVKEIESFVKGISGENIENLLGFENDLTCEITYQPELSNSSQKHHIVTLKKDKLIVLSFPLLESRFKSPILKSDSKSLVVGTFFVNNIIEQVIVDAAFEMSFKAVNFFAMEIGANILSFSGEISNKDKESLVKLLLYFKPLKNQENLGLNFVRMENFISPFLFKSYNFKDHINFLKEVELIKN